MNYTCQVNHHDWSRTIVHILIPTLIVSFSKIHMTVLKWPYDSTYVNMYSRFVFILVPTYRFSCEIGSAVLKVKQMGFHLKRDPYTNSWSISNRSDKLRFLLRGSRFAQHTKTTIWTELPNGDSRKKSCVRRSAVPFGSYKITALNAKPIVPTEQVLTYRAAPHPNSSCAPYNQRVEPALLDEFVIGPRWRTSHEKLSPYHMSNKS